MRALERRRGAVLDLATTILKARVSVAITVEAEEFTEWIQRFTLATIQDNNFPALSSDQKYMLASMRRTTVVLEFRSPSTACGGQL